MDHLDEILNQVFWKSLHVSAIKNTSISRSVCRKGHMRHKYAFSTTYNQGIELYTKTAINLQLPLLHNWN